VTEFENRKNLLNNEISVSYFKNLLHFIENVLEKISIASGYAQLRYAADTSSNEAASLVTRMDVLEAELTNRMLFFDIWFKKKINQDDACRLIDSVSPYSEFGHAIHSLAASDMPILVFHAVFAEMLLNDSLLKTLNTKESKAFLAEQIDDMYATIMRQAYFTMFEIEAHKAIADHHATIDKVAEIYLNNLSEQFGDSIDVSRDFRWEWLYIPHLYHTPFYCYAYSFGNLLVMSLYQQFNIEGKSFIQRYIKILGAAGSRKPEELLKDSGIDISNEEFWQQGFELVENKIKEFLNL
jgi:oligoendopeptidase F